jgi:excinuclease ABC subunit A
MKKRSRPSSVPESRISIAGARQNNLKNIDVEIPKGALTVVTGLSGSGKSSLAMETLYAEGQRRYLEGVSAYARRFLERLPRPEVDVVEGISPAVALDQRTGARNARSTVGTSTEIYDYLRLLFSRVGRVHCDECGEEVPRWTIRAVADVVLEGGDRRLLVSFPLVTDAVGRGAAVRNLRRRGYGRLVVGGEVADLEAAPRGQKPWHILQDRVRARDRGRLVEALETAFREGEGRAVVQPVGGSPTLYRLGRVCVRCDLAYSDPQPQQFSFNSPMGACPECKGFGYTLELDLGKIVPDENKTLEDGAIEPWARRWRGYFQKKLEASPRARSIPKRVPWKNLPPEDHDLLLHGDRSFPGVFRFLSRLSTKSYKAGARFLVKRYQSPELCSRCAGSRLRREALRVRVEGETLPRWCALSVAAVHERVRNLDLGREDREKVAALIGDLEHRLQVLERVGLGYLSLDRLTRTLSGGESQRIELAQALGAGLVSALYVLDEPTVGLHPRDTGRLLEVLRDLTRQGNTVVVVEHDRDMIHASDWMVDLGPGAGHEGGEVIYCGPGDRRSEGPWSPTLDFLRDRAPGPRETLVDPRGWIRLRDASLHNLRGLDVDIPWGVLVGVCGVSGSGKSTLVTDTLVPLLEAWGPEEEATRASGRPQRHGRGQTISRPGLGKLILDAPFCGLRVVDQSPLARSARSIPASYIGAWSGIRSLFASHPESLRRGLRPGDFSFNVKGGRCAACRGEGEITVDMDFMADIRLPCEACGGSRFSAEILEVRYRGHSIADVLRLTVGQALPVFLGSPSVTRSLRWMERVGLGYLTLGQPAPALSGGEAQRLKLVRELAAGMTGGLVILDEPTVGLHGLEVLRLVHLLRTLVRAGNMVLVIEHHTDVLAACDWLIELGPDGGEDGGALVAAGPPEVIVRTRESRIAPYLTPLLASGRRSKASGNADTQAHFL